MFTFLFFILFVAVLLFRCHVTIDWSGKKTFVFLRFLIFRSYPLCACCCHDFSTASIYLSQAKLGGLTVWIRYIMFCLQSLMMFAIYIKIQCLSFLFLPAAKPFDFRNTQRIQWNGYRFNGDMVLRCVPTKMNHFHRTSSNSRFFGRQAPEIKRPKCWF